MKQLYRQFKKYRIFAIVGFILVLVSVIPIRLASASFVSPYPQAFLTLGCGSKRE